MFHSFMDARRKEIADKAMAQLETYAQVVKAEAQRLCPIDTGQLRNSIGYTIRRSEMMVAIHADQPYAFFVEFGTRLQVARPFLRPALLAGRTIWNRGINTELQFLQVNASHQNEGFPLRSRRGGTLPMPRANSAVIRQRDITNKAIDRKLGRRQPKVVFGGNLSDSLKGYKPGYRGKNR